MVRPRKSVVGYVVLSAAVVLAFFTTWLNDQEIERARVERVEQLNRVNQAQCASLRNLYAILAKTLRDADDAADTLDYYRTHPKERAAAHARNEATIRQFRTPPCPPDFQIEEE